MTENHTTASSAISITPKHLTYGLISVGFLYNLSFSVKNNCLIPIRVRISCVPADKEHNSIRLVHLPEKVAPGMSVALTLELTAEFIGNSTFQLNASQSINDEVFTTTVDAHVVSIETFKHVKKSLQLQKRPIYKNNVSVVSHIQNMEQLSIASTTMTDAMLMDDDEIEDLFDFPMASNVYWDPFNKCLRIDPELGRVVVESKLTLEESKAKTLELRKARLAELEEQGFLTEGAIENLKHTQHESHSEHKRRHEEDEEEDNEVIGEMKDHHHHTTKKPSGGNVTDTEDEKDDIDGDQFTLNTGTSHAMSVTSLLAMKRDRIEKQRRQSIMVATEFAEKSKKDSMVNSTRTLNMIMGRMNKTIDPSTKMNID